MILDPTSNLSRVRLLIGDWSDIPVLPDSVILQTLTDLGGNVQATAVRCAQYILVSLSFKSHRKLGVMETWSNQQYEQYKDYLVMFTRDPSLNSICPIPYSPSTATTHPIIKFSEDWVLNFAEGTQSEQLSIDAVGSATTGM